MALVPDGKTEWQDLGSLEEKGAVVATPAKTMFNFSLKEINPTLQALEDMKERKRKKKKSGPHAFFFWLHHTSSLTRDGTHTHPLHWELRVITMDSQ